MYTHRDNPGVRSDARSCVECRRRKIRCAWTSEGDETTACDNCRERGRTCIPQQQRRTVVTSSARRSAQHRMHQLEERVASLAALIQDPSANNRSSSHLSPSQPSNKSLHENGDERNVMSEHIDPLNNVDRPSHLRLLFNQISADAYSSSQDQRNQVNDTALVSSVNDSAAAAKIRLQLRALLPSRDEVHQLSRFASEWMALYHTMFMVGFTFRTGDQLISNYDRMSDKGERVNPVSLGTYLLSIAITAQQVPSDRTPAGFHGGQGIKKFVAAVCETLEYSILNNNYFASTTEGLEAGLLFARLSLGRGDLYGTWLILRRILALAELVGLPRAQYRLASNKSTPSSRSSTMEDDSRDYELRANVWESICATDRNLSMMLNVPTGTARYSFPRQKVVYDNGGFHSRVYNYRLSNVCAAVFEIDESYLNSVDAEESYEKVITADRQLRALAAEVPKAWWADRGFDSPLDELLVQFWHNYITARVHLIPATMDGDDGQYAYSRSVCLSACLKAVGLFPAIRTRVPSGFFVCRVLDVQVFTVAAFLLVSGLHTSTDQSLPVHNTGAVDDATSNNILQVIECLEGVSNHSGSDLARESSKALRMLSEFVGGHAAQSSGSITLEIPLLGQIHVSHGQRNRGEELFVSLGRGEQEVYPTEQGARTLTGEGGGFSQPESISGMLQPTSQMPFQWSFNFDDLSGWTDSFETDGTWLDGI